MSTEDRVNKAMSDLIIANMHERYKDANIPEIKGVVLKGSNTKAFAENFEEYSKILKKAVEHYLGSDPTTDPDFDEMLVKVQAFMTDVDFANKGHEETISSLTSTYVFSEMMRYVRSKIDVPGLEGYKINSSLPSYALDKVLSVVPLEGKILLIDSLSEFEAEPSKIATAPNNHEADAMVAIRDAGRDRSIPTGIYPPRLSIGRALDGGFRPGELIAIGAMNSNPIGKSALTEFIQENIQRRQAVKEEMLEIGVGGANTEFMRDALQQQQKYVYDMDVSSMYPYQLTPYLITFNHKVRYTIYKEDGTGVTTMTVVLSSRKKYLRRLRQIQKAMAHSRGYAREAWKQEYQAVKATRAQFTKHINSGLAIRRPPIDFFGGKTITEEQRIAENHRIHDKAYGEVLKNLGENNENN